MKFLLTLAKVEAAAIVCLVGAAFGVVLFLACLAVVAGPGMPPLEGAAIVFVATLLYGLVPITALFAPAYAGMHMMGSATFGTASLLGAIPCGAFYLATGGDLLMNSLWPYALGSGLFVALGTHAIMRWWSRRP